MTSDPIFSSHAPAYWEAGYSVIPLLPNTKRPAIKSWTGYCDNLPSEKKREEWLRQHAECGVGLLLGTQVQPNFRIAAIDIDRDELTGPVRALIASPSGKVGKKGVTLFVRVSADGKLKSTTLRGVDGQAGDLLIGNKMTVLPPSIHPDTGEAYRHVGFPLLETPFEDLLVLDVRLCGVLARVCSSTHLADLQRGSSTHDAALRFVAELVAAKATDEEVKRVIAAALPDGYDGNTTDEVSEMLLSAREKGFAEDFISDGERTIATMVVELCGNKGYQLFRYRDEAYASVPTPEGGHLTFRVASQAFKRKVRHLWYEKTGKTIGQMPLSDAIGTMEAKALFEGLDLPVWTRVGKDGGEVFVDLCRADGQVVQISKDGWKLAYGVNVKFRRAGGSIELPPPNEKGNLSALKSLLNLDDERFLAIVAFLVSSMNPTGPYFGLLVEGEQGSGKSFLTWVLKSLVDPNEADRLRLPENERDLAIQAKEFRLLSYDNTSGMKATIADALCIVATGGGMATRKLYTDEDLAVISASRPFILNGIAGFAKRPDLLERSIYLHLDGMDQEKRRTEEEMKKEFFDQQPAILSGLYNLVSSALVNIENTPAPVGVRMADAARFISAAEGALDVNPGTLIRIISGSQEVLMVERINDEPLTVALREALRAKPFEGYVGELFEKIRKLDIVGLPRTAAKLSTDLERHKPALMKVGLRVQLLSRSSKGRHLRIEFIDEDKDDPAASPSTEPPPF